MEGSAPHAHGTLTLLKIPLPFGVCCTCWHTYVSFSIRINHLNYWCPLHGPLFHHQGHMYMIDRNPKAGQWVHVGMKWMTEVASIAIHMTVICSYNELNLENQSPPGSVWSSGSEVARRCACCSTG